MKKRLLSTILTLCMLLTLLPGAAFADGSEELNNIAVTAPVPAQGENILAALGTAGAEDMTLTEYSALQITDLQNFQENSLTEDNSRSVAETDVYEPGAVYMLRFTFSTEKTFAEYDDDLDATYNGRSVRMRDDSDDMARSATYYNGISDRYLGYPERETPEGGAPVSRLHICALTRIPYPVSTAQELADALADPDRSILRIDGTLPLSGTYTLTGQRITGGTILVPAGETLTLSGTAELNCALVLEEGAVIAGDGSLDRWNDPEGVIFLSAVSGTNATIAGCAFSGDVTLSGGTITGGVFSREDGPGGSVMCTDTAISGGRFRLPVTSSGIISGGDFAAHVWTGESFGSLTNTGVISGGQFHLPLTNRGSITDGSFSSVTNYGTISGGTYPGSFENHGTVDPAALRTVTFDPDGGSAVQPQQVLRGQKAQSPETPEKKGHYFLEWRSADGKKWNFSQASVLEDVTLTAYWITEQFTLEPGGTYYFDLSASGVPGTPCGNLPDTTLHYVPFTYTGTIEAYVLDSRSWGNPGASDIASQTREGDEVQYGYVYPHSLFIADYVITSKVGCGTLKAKNWIFGGKDFNAGGITYSVRIPSGGSGITFPQSPGNNEWDVILDKNGGWIKNTGRAAWVQDAYRDDSSSNIHRGGHGMTRHAVGRMRGYSADDVGFRPVLQPRDPETLGSDALKPVTLNLGGAALADGTDLLQIIVKRGESFAAPASEGLIPPADAVSDRFRWEDSNGNTYQPGDSVPAEVDYLFARWNDETYALATGKTYYFDLSGSLLPGETNQKLPDPTLHYVPFTYTGDIDAYVLTPASAGESSSSGQAAAQRDEAAPYGHAYLHSLFLADDAVTGPVSYDALNNAGLIFGTSHSVGGMAYTLRALTAGSAENTPANNEYTAIETKNSGYIKAPLAGGAPYAWAQDTAASAGSLRRTFCPDGLSEFAPADAAGVCRPVLEVPAALSGDSLRPITLNLNGGTLGGSSESIQIIVRWGESYPAPTAEGLTAPTGQRFIGWHDGQRLYQPGEAIPSSARRLSACWEQMTYSVTYASGENGTGSPQTVTKAFDQDLTLAGTLFTRDAYRQTGWAAFDGGEKIYDLGGIYSANESVTLYPVWTAVRYAITYHLDGGTAPGNPDSYTIESGDILLANPVKAGRSFLGWSGTGLEKLSRSVLIPAGSTGDREYTAHWTDGSDIVPPSYTLSFVPNGGDPMADVQGPYNALMDLAAYTPVRSGYTFTGWYSDSALTQRVTSLRLTGSHRVYAGWQRTALPFDDVRAEDWFHDDVQYVYEHGLISGTSDAQFSPRAFTTRGMVATILWRLEGAPVVNYAMLFTDVEEAAWYGEAVRWAAASGIVNGCGSERFAPNDPITRQQMAAILYRYASYKGLDVSIGGESDLLRYEDASQIADYALPALRWACGTGLMQGTEGRLLPDGWAARAQVAALLRRFHESMLK